MRSSIDFDGALPVYENETGTRFSLGLQETQNTNIFAQNDMTGVRKAMIAAAALLPIAAWCPTPPSAAVVATPQGWQSESPQIIAKKFPAMQQQTTAFCPQGQIFSITPQGGWWSPSPIITVKGFPAFEQIFSSTFCPQGPIYSITPQGWASPSPVILIKSYSASEQLFSPSEPPEPLVPTPLLGFAPSPAIIAKLFNASQQQVTAFAAQGPIYSITPEGWITEPPILLTKPFPAKLQQATAFPPSGQIYSITPQGWASPSPIIVVKGFPAAEQIFSSPDEPEPPTPTPLLGFAEWPALLAKPFRASQQQTVTFNPQGTIYSITPQGWASPSPVVLWKAFPAYLQQFAAFAPSGNIYSITPQGWISENPIVRARAYSAALQQFSATGPLSPSATFTQAFLESPALLRRLFLADEQPLGAFEPEPPFTNPLGFTSDIVLPRRKPFVDLQYASFTLFSRIEIRISFSPSPEIFARRTIADEVQASGFEPPQITAAIGFSQEPPMPRVKLRAVHQVTSFAPFAQTAAVATITWGWAGEPQTVFKHGFPAFKQQFIAFNNFFGVRLFKGPPLSGKSTTPGLVGYDAQELLSGKDTTPGLKGFDVQASLIATKSNSGLKASVDIDNSVALPLPTSDDVRVTVNGETRVTVDGESRVVVA